jgi:hypothetical protein
MKSEKSAAIALMAAAIIGLIVANSPLGPGLFAAKDFDLSMDFLNLNLSLEISVSDLFLAVFFFGGRPRTQIRTHIRLAFQGIHRFRSSSSWDWRHSCPGLGLLGL